MSYWRVKLETGVKHPYATPEWTHVRKLSVLVQATRRAEALRYVRQKHLSRMLRARKLTYQLKKESAARVPTDIALKELGAPQLNLGEYDDGKITEIDHGTNTKSTG